MHMCPRAPVTSSARENGKGRESRGNSGGVPWRTALAQVSTASLAAGVMGVGFEGGAGNTLTSVLVLGGIIAFHECGHFFAARAQGIHVARFSIGFGPRLVSFKSKDEQIEFSLSAIPLGGYVAFPDDGPESEFDPEDPDLLKNRPILDRFFVVSAGVVANMILALAVVFAQVSTVGLVDLVAKDGVTVTRFTEARSAAERAGVRENDVVLEIDGRVLGHERGKAVEDMVRGIKKAPAREVDLLVERKAASDQAGTSESSSAVERLHVLVRTDVSEDGSGRIGVQLSQNGTYQRLKGGTYGEAVGLTCKEVGRLTASVFNGLGSVFTNFGENKGALSGPIAILAVGSQVSTQAGAGGDPTGLYQFAAVVNVNLAAVNVLPLPALDGGYLVLLAIEAVRGKKLDKELEESILSGGVLLLFTLGMSLIVKDAVTLTPLANLIPKSPLDLPEMPPLK